MRVPTVQKCCCCLDLRIGVLALCALTVILNICYFVKGCVHGDGLLIVGTIITILAGVSAIVGIHKQISFWPYLLIPLLVVGVIAIITLILLPFFTHSRFSREYDQKKGTDLTVAAFVILFCWAIAAITSYLWIIVFSLFESMRQEASSKSGATKFTTP